MYISTGVCNHRSSCSKVYRTPLQQKVCHGRHQMIRTQKGVATWSVSSSVHLMYYYCTSSYKQLFMHIVYIFRNVHKQKVILSVIVVLILHLCGVKAANAPAASNYKFHSWRNFLPVFLLYHLHLVLAPYIYPKCNTASQI